MKGADVWRDGAFFSFSTKTPVRLGFKHTYIISPPHVATPPLTTPSSHGSSDVLRARCDVLMRKTDELSTNVGPPFEDFVAHRRHALPLQLGASTEPGRLYQPACSVGRLVPFVGLNSPRECLLYLPPLAALEVVRLLGLYCLFHRFPCAHSCSIQDSPPALFQRPVVA